MSNEELVQISKFLPEVKDRYYINRKGELYTNDGKDKMKDALKNGYVKNCLILKSGGQRSYFRHRLVMICFNKVEDYEKLQVNHIDGNKTNNNLNNLEWCTNQENHVHALEIGLAIPLKGEDNPASKLKEEQVIDIIQDLLNHVPYSIICKKYGCSKSTISAIKNKRNWTYLTSDINFD